MNKNQQTFAVAALCLSIVLAGAIIAFRPGVQEDPSTSLPAGFRFPSGVGVSQGVPTLYTDTTQGTDTNQKIIDQAAEKTFSFIPFTPVANFTGQPSMSVPLYWSDEGLPIGVMFTGRPAEEPLMFSLAGQLERARPWAARKPPIHANATNHG